MPNTGHVRGAQPTRGSVALTKCGESPEQIARRLGANRHTVGNWLRGHRRPGPAWRARLKESYGIEPDWWDQPIEFQPVSDEAARRALAALTQEAREERPPAGLLAALESNAGVAQPERAPACIGEVAGSSPAAGSDVPAAEVARQLLAQIQDHRVKVDADPMVTLDEKAKILGRCAQTLALVYKLTGEAADLSEAKILKSPAWGRIQAALMKALEPWPEAMRAGGEALISLAQDS